jgi:subtilisin family serine protease
MPENLYGKNKLCYTEISDFTDYQGIGRDPLYKRFDSVLGVVKQSVDSQFWHFLAEPVYLEDEDQILWYIDKWTESPVRFSDLSLEEKEIYAVIRKNTVSSFLQALDGLKGEDRQILQAAIKYIDDDNFIYCCDNKVFVIAWGMTPDLNKHNVVGSIVHDFHFSRTCRLTFDAGQFGDLASKSDSFICRPAESELTAADEPRISPHEGYQFTGWQPPVAGHKVSGSSVFHATYQSVAQPHFAEETPPIAPPEEKKVHVNFVTDGKGYLEGTTELDCVKGYVLSAERVPLAYANPGNVFVGWAPSLSQPITEDTTFTAYFTTPVVVPVQTPSKPKLRVDFSCGEHGQLKGNQSLLCSFDHCLTDGEIPEVIADEGYEFTGWTPSVDAPIEEDTLFTATYKESDKICRFQSEKGGLLNGSSLVELHKAPGSKIVEEDIPQPSPDRGYRFTGWNESPLGTVMDSDHSFVAGFEQLPWWRRLWYWFRDGGCLRWLLGLLLLLLLLFLLAWLLHGCSSCSTSSSDYLTPVTETPVDSARSDTAAADSSAVDSSLVDSASVSSNGTGEDNTDGANPSPIAGPNGDLPNSGVVAPIEGAPIVVNPSEPHGPKIISNRLNIYFNDGKVNLSQWNKDFKKQYPGKDFQVIGCDPNVPCLQIKIPESDRDRVRKEINGKMSRYRFVVVDESVVNRDAMVSPMSATQPGWHLQAINATGAWAITKGASNVIVAVVDDGFDLSHPMLKGKAVCPYNVFTQNSKLTSGTGHGTHVAALAVGSQMYLKQGASGIAPNCKLMPIQVFDGDVCTFSSMTSGLFYAMHHGADVVNLSLGTPFYGASALSASQQKNFAQHHLKNEESVLKRIFDIARQKNVILVFAAGNDNVLACMNPQNRFVNATVNVAAVMPGIRRTAFTDYGLGANVSAPGQAVYSAWPGNGLKVEDGTSMAAPIVSGTIALMRSLNKNLTVQQVLTVLRKSGRNAGPDIPVLIQADKALSLLKKGKTK